MKAIILTVSVILSVMTALPDHALAQTLQYFQVQDVRSTMRRDGGSIDRATLTVQPRGAYFEYGLYLDLSSKGTTLIKPTDTLEIQYFFSLPTGAMIIDSWLWVEDTIVKAMLIDRGQATQIYEGIVNRRKDPSVLYKNQNQYQYEFRIFPLVGSSFRRVKIAWLQPASWSDNKVTAQLPVKLLGSKTKLDNLRVIALTDSVWKSPDMVYPAVDITDIDDEFYGKGKEFYLHNTYFNSPLIDIGYANPMQNGVYLEYYEDVVDEGYYQLIMQLKKHIEIASPKKILFVLDYDVSTTNLTAADALAALKTAISSTFSPRDSFNILLSKNPDKPVSDTWLDGSATSLDAISATLNEQLMTNYSKLPELLPAAANYIKQSGKSGDVMFISSSDGYGYYKTANSLIEELRSIVDSPLKFHCIDFSTTQRRVNYQNNTYYYGNFYLYDYLTKWSGGTYLDAAKGGISFQDAISSTIQHAQGKVQSLEVYTTLSDGFCYGRYDQTFTQQQKDAGISVQFGRYYGKLPFQVRATGFYADKPFSKQLTVGAQPTPDPQRMLRRMWNGNYIGAMENGQKTNEIIKEIIDVSRRNRVLSYYTAFLALEPWMMPKGDYIFYEPKDDGSKTTDVIDRVVVETQLVRVTALPNPFTSSVTFEFSELAADAEILSVDIYNTFGEKVMTFSGASLNNGGAVVWHGDSTAGERVAAGVYHVVVKTNRGNVGVKVVMNQ